MTSELEQIAGVGAAVAEKLHGLGATTIDELIHMFPRRYEDYSRVVSIDKLRPGRVTIEATIMQAKGRYVRRGMHVTEAVASDETGSVRLVWFNQPYRAAAIKPKQRYYIAGEFGMHYRYLSIQNPSMEQISAFPVNTARIIPVYREKKGITSVQLRKIMRAATPMMQQLDEPLPSELLQHYELQAYRDAVQAIHFPANDAQLAAAQRRLAFQEIFELILASLLTKLSLAKLPAEPVSFDKALAQQFVAHLPFQLTDAQRRVTWQIYQDLEKPTPMNRLIEGDVGSGKTVVAAMTAVMVAAHHMQTAVMAPTELLARQHAQTFYELLQPLGMAETVVLLVGGLKPAEKKRAQAAIAAGKARIIIGTHALIQDAVAMERLALVVIDEQHRFGVEQRKKLMSKAHTTPHVLSLTATPIPRSLALTLYGELTISLLDAKPINRQPIVTHVCSSGSRPQVYRDVMGQLAAGRQVFVVCPMIDAGSSKASVMQVYDQVRKAFPAYQVGLLHGKLKAADKTAAMQAFVAGETDILVATTVIEVGVDVPNATVMIIESAEQFGLAQLHQLRGRVGRGDHAGTCYLMLSGTQAPSARLRALETSNNGFELAELDLRLRGPGAIYGTMQHGELDLRIASLTDTKLLKEAREAAEWCIARNVDLLQYPRLHTRIRALQKVTNLN